MTEYQLVQSVKPFLKKDYEVYEEVRMFTRSIDIVLKKGNSLISIEFKLNNWKKAFEQISDYQIISDYSYLCIPNKNLHDSTIKKINELGIGLLIYDHKTNTLKESIAPKPSQYKIDCYKEYIMNKLENYLV